MLLVSDRALLDAFRAGKPEALRTVYQQYRPRLVQLVRGGFTFKSGEEWMRFRGYGSEYEIDQAVQDAMSRAFLPAARAAYDGVRPYGDYLAAIARNHILSRLRHNDLLVPVDDDALARAAENDPSHEGEGGEPTLEEREVERLLAAFLVDASPVERRLFELRFRQEQPQEEAARAMSLSRIRLRRVEYKLKRRLLAYLKKNGYLAGVSRDVLGTALRLVLL